MTRLNLRAVFRKLILQPFRDTLLLEGTQGQIDWTEINTLSIKKQQEMLAQTGDP